MVDEQIDITNTTLAVLHQVVFKLVSCDSARFCGSFMFTIRQRLEIKVRTASSNWFKMVVNVFSVGCFYCYGIIMINAQFDFFLTYYHV